MLRTPSRGRRRCAPRSLELLGQRVFRERPRPSLQREELLRLRLVSELVELLGHFGWVEFVLEDVITLDTMPIVSGVFVSPPACSAAIAVIAMNTIGEAATVTER